ncbi:MAG: putative lipid II flippase FtsW [Firmicutes bacterium]|nr:putative lipid II flippase FtsW [Bacillota bacterium]
MPRPQQKNQSPDWWILISALLLLVVGLLMVFSSSQYFTSYPPYNDALYYLKRQAVSAVLGLAGLIVAYRMSAAWYRRLAFPAFMIVLALLVFMALSEQIAVIGGAQRWLEIGGLQFQPSELSKIVLPMLLASILTGWQREIKTFKCAAYCIGLTGMVCGLIILQKDLSTAVVVGAACFAMMLCAGIAGKYLLAVMGCGFGGAVLAIIMEPYRMERVYSWLNPWAYPKDEGYQAIQSLLALGSGGLTGVGLGNGGAKWFYLPSRHTDFIFSVLGEELGFVGGVFLVALFMLFVWRGMTVAVKSDSVFSSLLAVGLTAVIAAQALVNLGVVTGLLPVTGVTLPFVSYGGTSLVVTLTMTGMILNLSRGRR